MNAGYRLGYEAPFPAGVQDASAATRFLRTHAATYKVAPQRIGAVGGSAGGHIVGLMATASDNATLHGEAIQAAAVMAGPMEIITGSVAERVAESPEQANIYHWTGGTPDEKPDLYQLADAHIKISAGDAPTLFLVGSLDIPERNAPSRAAFKKHGVPTDVKIYENAKHGAWNGLPWQPRFVDDIDAWFKVHLK